MTSYLLLRIVYIICVIMFTGNMFYGLFRKIRADKTHNPGIIADTFRKIILNDLRITIPALIIILLLNFYINDGKTLPYSAIKLTYTILFVSIYSILMFTFIIHPIRSALKKIAENSWLTSFDEKKYKKLSAIWVMFGIMELGPIILVLLLSLA